MPSVRDLPDATPQHATPRPPVIFTAAVLLSSAMKLGFPKRSELEGKYQKRMVVPGCPASDTPNRLLSTLNRLTYEQKLFALRNEFVIK